MKISSARVIAGCAYIVFACAQTAASNEVSHSESDRDRATCSYSERGRLLRHEKVASYPTATQVRAYFDEWIAWYQDFYAFPANLPVTFRHGFDSYKVTYCTIDVAMKGHWSGRPTIASGMVSVPRKSGPLSTVLYLHGTSVSFYDAVSNPNIVGEFSASGESFDGPPSNAVFAGAGFIYVGPDYLGLGTTDVPRHRYFHAATEASSAVDLLAAARKVLAKLNVEQNDKLFTFGFSQGGHAALAAHRALERASVTVTGTATVGGVFDVEQWFLSLLTNDTAVTTPLYASYILLSYDDVYDIYRRESAVFRPPFAMTVDSLFDMQHYFDDVLAGLPTNSRALLTSSFFADVTTNSYHPLRIRLRQNAVDQYRLNAPIRIYHSRDDEEVPYQQAFASFEQLRRHGSDVTLRPLAGFDHVNSWIQAMPRAVRWFDSLD